MAKDAFGNPFLRGHLLAAQGLGVSQAIDRNTGTSRHAHEHRTRVGGGAIQELEGPQARRPETCLAASPSLGLITGFLKRLDQGLLQFDEAVVVELDTGK